MIGEQRTTKDTKGTKGMQGGGGPELRIQAWAWVPSPEDGWGPDRQKAFTTEVTESREKEGYEGQTSETMQNTED